MPTTGHLKRGEWSWSTPTRTRPATSRAASRKASASPSPSRRAAAAASLARRGWQARVLDAADHAAAGASALPVGLMAWHGALKDDTILSLALRLEHLLASHFPH